MQNILWVKLQKCNIQDLMN